jgi:excisionase family DNA binding protein
MQTLTITKFTEAGVAICNITETDLDKLVEEKVRQFMEPQTKPAANDLCDISAAAEFLGLKVPTLYSKVSKREIPFSKPGGKRLYFSKEELTKWIKGEWTNKGKGGKA